MNLVHRKKVGSSLILLFVVLALTVLQQNGVLQIPNFPVSSSLSSSIFSKDASLAQSDSGYGSIHLTPSARTTERKPTPTAHQSVAGVSSSSAVLVTKVVDGDTIKVSTGQTVRYIGIDTPETKDPRKPVQCFGKEASAENTKLVLGKKVRMEKDVSETDRYGRLLRYVYVVDSSSSAELFVNEALVKEGFAHSYPYPPDIAKQDIFRLAETYARDHNLGLWISCK